MSSNVELVLFFGPPFVGKTLHYFQHYSKTHSRVSASETFKEDKCSNLRLVILNVVELLNKGKNVVMDDENWYMATRQSYIGLVKQKVSNCTFSIVEFIPDVSSGYQRCLWSREWKLVEQTLMENKDYNSTLVNESDKKLNCWFARKKTDQNPPEFPTAAEGFSIKKVQLQLMCKTFCKFTLPALLIQWQAILADENCSLKLNVSAILNKWSEKNHSGRIIIIGPKTKNNSEIIDEQMKTLLLQLASQLTNPVYFTLIDVNHQMDEYSCLPQPGVLAFLQKLHTLNLGHKEELSKSNGVKTSPSNFDLNVEYAFQNTIYVYSSDEHYRAASSVGIRTIKATRLFSHPHLIESVFCREPTSTFLHEVVQVNCCTSQTEIDIPFFAQAKRSSTSFAWKYCYGKVSGVCFKDKLTLERYQTQYRLAAKPGHPPGKRKQKTSKTGRSNLHQEPSSSSFNLLQKPSKETSHDAAFQRAMTPAREADKDAETLVEKIDLRDVAESHGRFLGGFQCKDNVSHLNVEVLEQRLKITGKCKGSSETPYDVKVVLSYSSEVREAHCTCPDIAGKTGRCKHVIGLLLNYKKRTQNFEEQNIPSSSKSSGDYVKKNISKKRDVQTLYCMSQEELLETAKEILKKHEEKLKQEHRSVQVPQEESNEEILKQHSRSSSADKNDDILDDVLFSAINYSEKSGKKFCSERSSNLVEDTPEHSMPRSENKLTTVIIPDSLVPETVSLVPETIRTLSTTHSSLEENHEKESFETFLDEMI